jgi:hypothetical protein
MDQTVFAEIDNDELAETIVQLHALLQATEVQLLSAIGCFARREAFCDDGATSMTRWLTERLSVSASRAGAWSAVAGRLAELPALTTKYADGELTFDQLQPLSRVATAETEAVLADRAVGLSVAQCEQLARRARPVTTSEANEDHEDRFFRFRWRKRKLCYWGEASDLDGAALLDALFKTAGEAPADPESDTHEPLEQRLGDALVGLASVRLGDYAEAGRATVICHVDADSLAGHPGEAELDGGPAIAAETARRICCDSRLQIVLENNGKAIGLGRRMRTVPPWLARQLKRRDSGCRFPGCGRVHFLHAHHLVYWADGGPTDPENLVMLCSTHHRVVHERRWRIEGDPHGVLTFLRPGGHTYDSKPTPLRPDLAERLRAWTGTSDPPFSPAASSCA